MDWLKHLSQTATWDILIPGAILAAIFALGVWVLWRAQKRSDFDLADMLRNDENRGSNTKAGFFVALGVSSWVIATLTVQKTMTVDFFWAYNVTFSGSFLLKAAIDKWNGVVPFTKGEPTPPKPTE